MQSIHVLLVSLRVGYERVTVWVFSIVFFFSEIRRNRAILESEAMPCENKKKKKKTCNKILPPLRLGSLLFISDVRHFVADCFCRYKEKRLMLKLLILCL